MPSSALRRIARLLDAGLEGLCVALLAATVSLTVLQVFYRYILGASIAWTEELARFAFVWSVFLGFAVLIGREQHMRLDMLRARGSPRLTASLDFLALAIVAAASIAMILHGGSFAMRVTGASGALEWPTRWLYLAVPVGAAFTLLQVACKRPLGEGRWWAGLAAIAVGAACHAAFLSDTPLLPIRWSVGWTLHVVALGLMVLDVPIAFCLIIAAYASFAQQGELMLMPISQALAASVNSFLLLSIPFFILAAQVMNAGGITHHLVRFAAAMVGHMRGGLAQVNVVTNTVMGGLSGSSLAVAAGTAKVLVPEMAARGYPRAFAAAVSASASTVDNLIPPSIGLIVFAALGSVSVGALFTAGIVPGLLMAAAMMLVVHWQATRRNFEAARRPATLAERGRALRDAIPALLVPIGIVGGMRAGAFTASEAGAIAVVYAIAIGKLAYKRFRWRDLPGILRDGFRDTVAIIAIVAAAAPFGWILGIERIPQVIAESLGPLAREPLLFLLLINVFLLIVGMFLETVPALLILSSILLPVVKALGIDPVHFGVIICYNLILGIITPPMGIGLFVAARVANITPEAVLRASWPFFIPLLAALVVISAVPALSLWLPTTVYRWFGLS